jgi:predicted N-acetyltransferase YhbS
MGEITEQVSTRAYNIGDEERLVSFLNICFHHWGDLELWRWRYKDYPGFENDNVFIQEKGTELIGHRGLHFRDLMIRSRRVLTATLGDTAIHPECRGRGIYAQLHQLTLQAAKAKGASLAITWNHRGSATHKHNKNTGFIEIKRNPTYVRLVNGERVFWKELSELLNRNVKLKSVAQGWQNELCFCLGNSKFSAAELLGGDSEQSSDDSKQGNLRVIFQPSALPLVLKLLRTRGKLQARLSLLLMILSGKIKIRFTSLRALLIAAKIGLQILSHV